MRYSLKVARETGLSAYLEGRLADSSWLESYGPPDANIDGHNVPPATEPVKPAPTGSRQALPGNPNLVSQFRSTSPHRTKYHS